MGRCKVFVFSGYLTSAVFTSLPWLITLFALYGITNAAVDGNQRAFIADLALPEVKGIALGTFHTVAGLMALPAGLIAGALWAGAGSYMVFVYGEVIGFSCSLLLLTCFNK